MAAIATNKLSGQAIAEMAAIAKLNEQFKKHSVIYSPFDVDLEAEKVRQDLLAELRRNRDLFAPTKRDIELLQTLRNNLHTRLAGAQLAIFGTPLEKMRTRALRDMDLQKHKQMVVKKTACVLRERITKTPVAYRPFSQNVEMLKFVTDLALYFSGNPLGGLDLQKDIYLFGASQKGKTTIFKALQSVFEGTITGFGIVDCTQLVFGATVGKLDIVAEMERLVFGNLLLDDIGNADPYMVIKGGNINVVATIYRERLTRAEKTGCKTFFTSNFDLENLELRQNKFGNSFFSKTEIERIRTHCNIIAMPID